jgi:tetratricopeptide (TPR) repeat protein
MRGVSLSISEMEAKGKKLLDHGNFDGAKKIFDRILENDPDNLFALDKTGVIFARRGILDDAEPYFRKVLSIDPRYKTAWNNLGNILLQKGEIEKAKNCYVKAIDIDENYAQAYHNLAAAYKKEGDIAGYIKNLKKSARLEKHELGRKIVRWFRKN